VFGVTLLGRDRSILASAYELGQAEVDQDAAGVHQWQGTEGDLLRWLEGRHGWTVASEYAPHYVAALRTALQTST